MLRPRSRLVSVNCLLMLSLLLFSVSALAEPVEIEHFMGTAVGEAVRQATQQVIDLFHSVQDEIRVNLVYVSGDYSEHIAVRTAAGSPPDVMVSGELGEVGAKGLALPLDQFIDRDGLREYFVPSALALSTWDGQLIQIPQWVQPASTYYNTMHFANAGLQTPDQLSQVGAWNWETMAEAARAINNDVDGDGVVDVWGMSVRAHQTFRAVFWLKLAGGYFFDRPVNPTEGRMNTPEVATALEFLYNLVYEKNVMPLDAAITTQGQSRFSQNNVGMIFEGPWAIGYMRSRGMSDEDWDIAPLPTGPAGDASFIHLGGLQIARGSKHPEEAWEWIKFLTTDERALEIMTKETGRPATYIPALKYYTDLVTINGRPQNTHAIMEAILDPEATPFFPIVANVGTFNEIYSTNVLKYFRNQQSLGQTLETIDVLFNAELARLHQ